jgi:hypothetical protein
MEHHPVSPISPVAPGVPPPIAPVPMSFPALLVNPKSRVAQLRTGKEVRVPVKTVEITGKGQGKRWIRRAENSTSFSALPTVLRLIDLPRHIWGQSTYCQAYKRAITSCRPSNFARPSLDPFLLIFLASALPPHQ